MIYVVDASAPEKIGPATIDLIGLLGQPSLQVNIPLTQALIVRDIK